MIRKIFLTLAFFLSAFCAFAQSMTDDAVIQFVQSEMEKGTNQQAIVSKLLQKGVTPEQLRRIRKKYEAQQSQLGAVDLLGQDKAKSSTNRLRTNKEKVQDQLQQQNGYMVRSKREEIENRYKTRIQREEELNGEVGFLDIDSLVYYQNLFKDES
ncbi:MAG: capsule biosynthesis protein, partial [Bacteroidaceae bacterium]|nr:capsule biosynthesis protein [Bacteroidaceae bacterium]